MGTKKLVLIITLSVIGLVGFIIFIANLDNIFGEKYNDYNKKEKTTVTFDGESYVQNSTSNYLIFGLDSTEEFKSSGSYYNTDMCDFIMILNIDNDNKQYSIFEINRNSMVNVIQLSITGRRLQESSYEQIAYAFNQGDGLIRSCNNVLNTVSELIYNLKIDYYLAMKMPAINIVNDSIGGVDITLNDDQDMSTIDESWTPGAKIHLENGNAEDFVRARSSVGDGTNESRMTRQTQYMEAFIDQVTKRSETSTETLLNAFIAAEEYLLTDVDPYGIDAVFNSIKDYEYMGSFTPEGTIGYNENNNALFYINQTSFDTIVKKLFFKKYEK